MNEQKKEARVRSTPGPMLFWVISGKNAYQTFLMIYFSIACIPLILGTTNQNSPLAGLNHWFLQGFGVALLTSCVMNLIGVYWRGSLLTGLRAELLGSSFLASFSLAFIGVVLGFIGFKASVLLSIIILALLAIAGSARVWQIISAYRQVLSFKKEIASLTELE